MKNRARQGFVFGDVKTQLRYVNVAGIFKKMQIFIHHTNFLLTVFSLKMLGKVMYMTVVRKMLSKVLSKVSIHQF